MGASGPPERPTLLLGGESGLSVDERLLRAAEHVTEGAPRVASTLRPEQVPVVERFEELLLDVATAPGGEGGPPFWRIVLPPRTGKTVVAAHIIARTNLSAAFLVPTLTLADQVAAELRAHLPGVRVGALTGTTDAVVEGGVNVATMQVLQIRSRRGRALPIEIAGVGLVFVDEAHHAMTGARLRLLGELFDERTLRVALTATPDYGRARRLHHHFPVRIAERGIGSALRAGLLAPARAWVAEVDVDASTVRVVGGDYEPEAVGRLMSAAPFFRAAELFRYDPANASTPALVCCSSRQQASDLVAYLRRHRPPEAPEPQLLLGETPLPEREEILAAFERGEVDTLVQVGVLIEGWDSPRCKLLIDLAPSRSRVRATQKYFRVMTRADDAEARIYVLLPKDLPDLPLLPPDLLGAPLSGYEAGSLLGRSPQCAGRPPSLKAGGAAISDVTMRQRILLSCPLERPRLRRGDWATVALVLRSCEELTPELGMRAFRRLLFRHPKFTGSGAFLLEHLGVRDFPAFMARMFPDELARRALEGLGWRRRPGRGPEEEQPHELVMAHSMGGYSQLAARSAEDVVIGREEAARMRSYFSRLKARERVALEMRFGLDDRDPSTWEAIGARFERTKERARTIAGMGLGRLRWCMQVLGRDEAPWQLRGIARVSRWVRPPAPRPRLSGVAAIAARRATDLLVELAAADHPPTAGSVAAVLRPLGPASRPEVERWARHWSQPAEPEAKPLPHLGAVRAWIFELAAARRGEHDPALALARGEQQESSQRQEGAGAD